MSEGWTTLIAADAARELIAAGGALLIDCRFDLADPSAGRQAFLAGHLPGAHFFDLDRDLSGRPNGSNGRHPLPERAALARRLAAAGLDGGAQVIAYDDAGGAFAARLWWLLRWLGHACVAVLDGGLTAWRAAGGSLVEGPAPAVAAGLFHAAAGPGMPVMSADEVGAKLRDTDRLLIDARSPDRFAGAPHPLDPIAGHIPGAANRFYRDNLSADGRFASAAQLAEEYGTLLAGRPASRTTVYCGSGVTATHDILAMTHAGLPGAALYPGSWSDWIADPARPIERPAD